MKNGSVFSSFQTNKSRRLETFYEDGFEEKDSISPLQLNNSLNFNYPVSRSASFSGNIADGPQYKNYEKRAQSLRPRRNSEVPTNIEDHIKFLDEEKYSIMNLMDDAFY